MPLFGYIAIAVVLLVLLWAVVGYNGFIKLRNDTEEAFSSMDVFLKKRFDLIPNLVETVKGYAKHEAATLENVVKARNMAASASTAEDRIRADSQLTGALKTLFAVAEAYPDLKANAGFLDLQRQLQRVEEEIANSRRYYNAVVKAYNTKTEVFPSSILASLFHFQRKPLYVIEEEQRENVHVSF